MGPQQPLNVSWFAHIFASEPQQNANLPLAPSPSPHFVRWRRGRWWHYCEKRWRVGSHVTICEDAVCLSCHCHTAPREVCLSLHMHHTSGVTRPCNLVDLFQLLHDCSTIAPPPPILVFSKVYSCISEARQASPFKAYKIMCVIVSRYLQV